MLGLHARICWFARWELATVADKTSRTFAGEVCDCSNAFATVQARVLVNAGGLQLVKAVLNARIDQTAVFPNKPDRALAIKVFQNAGKAFATVFAFVAQLAIDVCKRTAWRFNVIAKHTLAAGAALSVLHCSRADRFVFNIVVARRAHDIAVSVARS